MALAVERPTWRTTSPALRQHWPLRSTLQIHLNYGNTLWQFRSRRRSLVDSSSCRPTSKQKRCEQSNGYTATWGTRAQNPLWNFFKVEVLQMLWLKPLALTSAWPVCATRSPTTHHQRLFDNEPLSWENVFKLTFSG